jgi:hypothetical protein
MNDATLRQATATAKDAAEDLKTVAREVRERATTTAAAGGTRVADELEGTAKDVKGAARDAQDAARHVEDVAQVARVAGKDPGDLDDIERIERRMNARRQSIRRHLDDAKENVERTVARTTRSWPIVVGGVALAAVAVGYAVAQRNKPSSRARRTAKSVWNRAREAPDAARRYVHEATKPPSRVWTERLAAGTGFAMAVARALPQIRALVAGMQAGRRAAR